VVFVGEAQLTTAISGSTSFAAQFERRGPYNHQGRSLRQFDLTKRLFRYYGWGNHQAICCPIR
jgi:hypothetical protein